MVYWINRITHKGKCLAGLYAVPKCHNKESETAMEYLLIADQVVPTE
jgi:hypothetical protein